MICVLATIEVADGRRGDFLKEFRRVVPTVLREDGCLEYVLMIDLPTNIPAQPPSRDNVVTVVEKWESIAALEAHLMAPHMCDYRTRVKPMVVGTVLQVLQPA
jgi:quinol monooxygenase YgiN